MNCCNCICPRRRTAGIVGPMGPVGPRGPAGGSLSASFFQPTSGELAAGAVIPLNDISNFAPAYVSHVAGSPNVVLTAAGYYKITYNTTVSPTATGVGSLSVLANGAAIPQSVTSANVTGGETANLTSSFVYNNVAPGTVLTLSNTSGEEATFTNSNFVVEYLTPTI